MTLVIPETGSMSLGGIFEIDFNLTAGGGK